MGYPIHSKWATQFTVSGHAALSSAGNFRRRAKGPTFPLDGHYRKAIDWPYDFHTSHNGYSYNSGKSEHQGALVQADLVSLQWVFGVPGSLRATAPDTLKSQYFGVGETGWSRRRV